MTIFSYTSISFLHHQNTKKLNLKKRLYLKQSFRVFNYFNQISLALSSLPDTNECFVKTTGHFLIFIKPQLYKLLLFYYLDLKLNTSKLIQLKQNLVKHHRS